MELSFKQKLTKTNMSKHELETAIYVIEKKLEEGVLPELSSQLLADKRQLEFDLKTINE